MKSGSFIWITRFENQYQKEESNPFRPVGVKYYSEKDLDTRTASEGEVENFPNNFGNGNSSYSPGWRQNVGLEFTITLYPFESHFIKVFSLFFVIGYLSQLYKKKTNVDFVMIHTYMWYMTSSFMMWTNINILLFWTIVNENSAIFPE